MARKAAEAIILTDKETRVLEKIRSTRTIEYRYHQRATIILRAAGGESNYAMTKSLTLMRNTVKKWRKRWIENKEKLEKLETEKDDKKYIEGILGVLKDNERVGHPLKFTAEQVCQIIAVSCEPPADSGHMVSHWSEKILAAEVRKRGIVESISKTHVGRFLKSSRHKAS